MVVERAPDRVVVVERDRVVDLPLVRRLPHAVDLVLERELRRVDPDHDQAVIPVGPRPGTYVRLRAQPVDARERPEVHENDVAAQLVWAQRLRPQPLGRPAERGHVHPFEHAHLRSARTWASSISASRVWRPRFIAAPIRRCTSGSRTPSPKRSESRRKSSAGASAIALTRSLTALAGGREPGNPKGERSDEIAQLVGGQRSIDPAVPFSQLGVVVLGAQHHLERPPATHEPCEVLRGAAAGEHAECRLELPEDRRLSRGEAHVARQHELTARAAHAALDLRDRDEPARAQVVKQEGDRRSPVSLRPPPGTRRSGSGRHGR